MDEIATPMTATDREAKIASLAGKMFAICRLIVASADSEHLCLRCVGSGRIYAEHALAIPCPACGGSGKINPLQDADALHMLTVAARLIVEQVEGTQ